MRTVFQVIAALVVVALVAAIGIGVYNACVSAGLAENIQALPSDEALPFAPYAPYGPYAYGWGGWQGPGFGFFGILFWILGIILIFALLRAAFGRGRWGGGPGWWGPGGQGRDRIEALHRELHERQDAPSTQQS
jgi:hypothetical protein